jgi:hypothetical protein
MESPTKAMQAKEVLARIAVRAEVVKSEESSRFTHGCAYAISFSCLQEQLVKQTLREAGIRYRG